MNKILATVTNIQTKENLNIVKFDFQGTPLSMMSLDLDNLNEQSRVYLTVKPSNIAIAKNFTGEVSYSNQLQGKISSIENGELLSSIKVQIADELSIESIITYNSSKRMNLQTGDLITLFIKASELSILEVLDV